MVDSGGSSRGLHTRACQVLGISHPIVLGGMAGGTSPELVAAVSNAGGLGVFGAGYLTPDDVRTQIARIRALTPRAFGINFLLFRLDDAALDAALAERPAVLSFGWARRDQALGPLFERVHAAGALVMHMVSRVDEAVRAAEAGADLVVAQGTEGGGHVGVMGGMVLVPMVVDAVRGRPVLAAGGIADGRGLAAALALGADGVLIGTRFLATEESPLHPNYKQAILDSDGHDTDLTEIPDVVSGQVWPGAWSRAWRNAFIRQWSGREWELRLRRSEVLPEVLAARAQGDVQAGVLLVGQDAGLIGTIEPAADLLARLVTEAHEIMSGRLISIAVPPM